MFKNNVYTFRNFPVEEKQRKWTDCCCTILVAIFALTLFILSFCLFTKENYYIVNYPVDNTGKSCYYEQTDAPFIYFQNVNDLTSRKYCVSTCPKLGDQLKCSKLNNCGGLTSSYESVPITNQLGFLCQPANPTLNDKFWANPTLQNKLSLIGGYRAIWMALLVGLCVGVIYLIIVMLIPKMMTSAVFILAFLSMLIAAILLFVQPIQILDEHTNTWNVIFGIVFIAIALFFLIFFFCQSQQLQIGSIFLQNANQILKERFLNFFYIPVFLVLSFGLVVLCVWQYIAFGTINSPFLTAGDLYKTSGQNMFLQILNLIQFVWGIQFLRDTFNYIISGNIVQSYFSAKVNEQGVQNGHQYCRSTSRFFIKNFGSVAGGSFLNAFFNIFGVFYDLFRCDPKGSCGRASRCCKDTCSCCDTFFDLVRADAYAYIHLSGIPYCNAARQCEALCQKSHLFNSDYSCIRLYRMAAQVFLVSLTALLTFAILSAKVNFASFIIVGVLICTSYLVVTYFSDIHSNAAQSLVICYLAEQNCEKQEMEMCPAQLRRDVYDFQQKNHLQII